MYSSDHPTCNGLVLIEHTPGGDVSIPLWSIDVSGPVADPALGECVDIVFRERFKQGNRLASAVAGGEVFYTLVCDGVEVWDSRSVLPCAEHQPAFPGFAEHRLPDFTDTGTAHVG